MADDKTKAGKDDRKRINVTQEYELQDWAQSLGVSPDDLRRAVQEVGPMVKDVRQHLAK